MVKRKITSNPPWHGVPVRGPMHRVSGIAKYLQIGRSTVYELIARGDLPRPIRLSAGISVIPESWLDAIVEAQVLPDRFEL